MIRVDGTGRDIGENRVKSFYEQIGAGGGSPNTQKRYERDVKLFLDFLGERKITPEILNEYKSLKLEEYSAATVKSMIFGINKYLGYIGCKYRINNKDLVVTRHKTSDEQLTPEEYQLALRVLKSSYDGRLYIIVETICNAGLKYSELRYLTAEAVGTGLLVLPEGVRKNPNVYLPKNLCTDIKKYCRENGIYHGYIFRTKFGNFPDRKNMSDMIKDACKDTGIDPKKLSMRAFKDFYTSNFENVRIEMAELIDEDLRILHTPSFAENNENSFRSFALKWLNNGENGLTATVKTKYSRICEKYIFPVLGNTDCRRITRDHVDSATENICDMSLKTRADIKRIMWLTLDLARKKGLKIRVSQKDLCTVKSRGKALRILSDDETEKLVKYLKSADSDELKMCAGIYLALNTGIRAEELCALKRREIDFDRRMLRISGSAVTSKRLIFLPEFLVDFLKPVYEKMKADCYLINGFSNRIYEVSAVENKLKKIAARCGIFDVNFVAVRDTFAARCAENDMEMKTLAEIMGSDDVRIYYPDLGVAESPLEFLREAY